VNLILKKVPQAYVKLSSRKKTLSYPQNDYENTLRRAICTLVPSSSFCGTQTANTMTDMRQATHNSRNTNSTGDTRISLSIRISRSQVVGATYKRYGVLITMLNTQQLHNYPSPYFDKKHFSKIFPNPALAQPPIHQTQA
jgi:hypothetical protein